MAGVIIRLTDQPQPILDRIQATDRLIDQIIYKLYGLTQDEIAIVESTAIPAQG